MKAFFVNLYDKFINLSFVQWTIDYCKENPIMAGIIGGLLVLIIVVLCIMGGTRRKAKKAAKKAAQTEGAESNVPEAATVPPAPAKEEVTAEKEIAPAVATVEEVAPVEKVTVKKQSPSKEEQKKTANEVEETFAMLEKVDENTPEILQTHYEEDETDKIARYAGKWSICRVLTDEEDGGEMYFFELRASNGEKLLSSEEYTTYQGALRGIQTHKTNILNGNLKITLSKKGDYIFKLLSGKNMLLCLGENYPTKARCESAMESTKRFAETAVLDENIQDIVVKVPKEEDSPTQTFPEGSVGKWIIFPTQDANGAPVFAFELFANNGERLLSSEEYTTYIGAVNGIQTYKNNIQKNNFRISLTKRGDYVYKLLNGNGQLLCLGEHYKTKRLCQNAVESVKRFALSSPLLTENKN